MKYEMKEVSTDRITIAKSNFNSQKYSMRAQIYNYMNLVMNYNLGDK